ncbi:MAG: HAD-IA family hydrolase [Pseudomonadota bacterium]
MSHQGIRGILFDKDGTLLDFEATWRGFALDLLRELAPGDAALRAQLGEAAGVDAETGAFRPGSPIVAGATREVAEIWAALLPGRSADALEAEAERRALSAAAAPPAPATPDLPGLLDRLARPEGGAPRALGIATHDSGASAKAHMRLLGALDRFDFIAGYDSGHGLKPGPGLVQAFCAATGLRPEEVAMIGDSLHDLGAGRAAGCGAVIGVLSGPAPAETLAPHADAVLPHIGALPAWLGDPG